MVRRLVTLMVAMAVAGCAGRNFKVDHPVVGPPPPRIRSGTQVASLVGIEDDDGQTKVLQVASQETSDAKRPLPMTAVAALVNGEPILVGWVLAPARAKLKAIEASCTPAQFRMVQEQALHELLPPQIEQALMVQGIKAKVTADQLKNVEQQLDKSFEKFAFQQLHVSSMLEVEALLQQQGLTTEVYRKMWGDRALAEEYMKAKLGDPPQVSAPELRQAYRERQEEFREPAAVRWQQIQFSFEKYDRQDQAEATAQAALAALRQGSKFSEVAKRYSDGPDAARGGTWDWTQLESLMDALREPLSRLPLNTPSGMIRTDRNVQVVQVLERRPERVRPFEEVQDQLRLDLLKAKNKAKFTAVLEDMKAKAIVKTLFDVEEPPPSATPAAETSSTDRFSAFSREGS